MDGRRTTFTRPARRARRILRRPQCPRYRLLPRELRPALRENSRGSPRPDRLISRAYGEQVSRRGAEARKSGSPPSVRGIVIACLCRPFASAPGRCLHVTLSAPAPLPGFALSSSDKPREAAHSPSAHCSPASAPAHCGSDCGKPSIQFLVAYRRRARWETAVRETLLRPCHAWDWSVLPTDNPLLETPPPILAR